MLINKLIEGKWDFIVISDPVLFQYNGSQARKSGVADGIHELMNLLALKQRLEGLAMVIFCVLKRNLDYCLDLKQFK